MTIFRMIRVVLVFTLSLTLSPCAATGRAWATSNPFFSMQKPTNEGPSASTNPFAVPAKKQGGTKLQISAACARAAPKVTDWEIFSSLTLSRVQSVAERRSLFKFRSPEKPRESVKGKVLGKGKYGCAWLAIGNTKHSDDVPLLCVIKEPLDQPSGICENPDENSPDVEYSVWHELFTEVSEKLPSSQNFIHKPLGKYGKYIFSEYCPGTSMEKVLSDWIKPDLVKNKEVVIRFYMGQLVLGLLQIHACGYAHNDIGMQNLFIDNSGNLKISDFGLTQLPKTDVPLIRFRKDWEQAGRVCQAMLECLDLAKVPPPHAEDFIAVLNNKPSHDIAVEEGDHVKLSKYDNSGDEWFGQVKSVAGVNVDVEVGTGENSQIVNATIDKGRLVPVEGGGRTCYYMTRLKPYCLETIVNHPFFIDEKKDFVKHLLAGDTESPIFHLLQKNLKDPLSA